MPLIGIPAIMGARGSPAVSAFSYKRSLTVDHTLVPSDQSDFPVLVSFTNATFKTVGNGGHVQNANGYDILFFSDSGLTTQLDYQIDFYDGTNGIIVMWVSVSSLSSSVDTVFYMGYGNASISSSQENASGLWGSTVKGCYHLGNGTTLSVADNSGNAHDGTNNSATAVAGQIDGGAAFSGSSQYITLPSTADWNFGTGDFTLSCWFYVDSVAAGYQALIGKDVDTNRQWVMGVNIFGDSKLNYISLQSVNTEVSSTAAVSDDTWYLGHITKASDVLTVYLNGTAGSTDSDTDNYSGTGQIWLAAREYPGFPQYLDGSLDEVRIIVGTARSQNWITTEYNNQSSPASFITLGTET